jgi:hypothetical protein
MSIFHTVCVMLNKIIIFSSPHRPLSCTNCLQPDPDTVVLIGPFFTLNSYTSPYAKYCTDLRFGTTSLNESLELQGTIYINTNIAKICITTPYI